MSHALGGSRFGHALLPIRSVPPARLWRVCTVGVVIFGFAGLQLAVSYQRWWSPLLRVAMEMKLNLAQQQRAREMVRIVGPVFEHSPWIAGSRGQRPFTL